MRLLACPDCGREVSYRAPVCPGCGLPDPAQVSAAEAGAARQAFERRIRIRASWQSAGLLIPWIALLLWVVRFVPVDHKPKVGFLILFSIPVVYPWRLFLARRKEQQLVRQ